MLYRVTRVHCSTTKCEDGLANDVVVLLDGAVIVARLVSSRMRGRAALHGTPLEFITVKTAKAMVHAIERLMTMANTTARAAHLDAVRDDAVCIS